MTRLAWALFLLGSGCSMNSTPFGIGAQRTSDWFETGKVMKSRQDIASTIEQLLQRQGYRLEPQDGSGTRFETDWDTHLSTHWREGYRVKIEAEILPLEDGCFNVRVRSSMEINDTSTSPGIAEQAAWVPAGVSDKHKDRIGLSALQIRTQLKTRFFGLNP